MKEQLFIPDKAIGKVWFSDSPNLDYFHRHDELECNLVVRGHGSYIVDEQRIDLAPNSIAWLFPEQDHLMLNTSDDFAMWIFVIRPSFLQRSCIDQTSQPLLQRKPAGLHVRHLDDVTLQKLVTICTETVAAKETSAYTNSILGYLLHSCWGAYLQGSIIPLKQNIHPAIGQVARQLSEGTTQDNLQSLSQQVGLTPETISRLFKKQTGVSFSQYRNRCRLDRFLALYGDGYKLTMLDAAREAGFGSYAQFYRVFREVMGQTPAAYRKQI
ncbi:MAG: helix-turn-helix domain-containing protein [Anaerolineae bacterium]